MARIEQNKIIPGKAELGCCRYQGYYIAQNTVDGCNSGRVGRKTEITGWH